MSRHPTPPALSSIASLCNTVSLTINELASSPYREPGFSLDAVDDEYGTAVVPDPLTNAHELIRFFLLGAGDNLYAIGKLLDLPSPMLVSPAVLARATAEYSSRAAYLAEASETPLVRMSKMAALFADGFKSYDIHGPAAAPAEVALAKGIGDWRAANPSLPKIKIPQSYQALVDKLAPSLAPREFPLLHRLVHANAVAISITTLSAQLDSYSKVTESWRHGLFASMCGLMSIAKVRELWQFDMEPVQLCVTLYYDAERTYNRYLWDLSRSQGFEPSEPRP